MALPCGEELPYVFGTVYAAAASRNAPPFHVRGCRVTSFDHCARAQAPPFVLYTHTLFLARDVVVLEYRICTYCCQIHAPPPPLLFFFPPRIPANMLIALVILVKEISEHKSA